MSTCHKEMMYDGLICYRLVCSEQWGKSL